MDIEDAVGEIGPMTVLALADGRLTEGSAFYQELVRCLPTRLPTGGLGLGDRFESLVGSVAVEVFPSYDRVVLAGHDLIILEGLARVGCSLPILVATPPWTSDATARRIESNIPQGLDVEVLTLPSCPDGSVPANRTLLLLCGFDAGAGMWLMPSATRAVLDMYRSQFLYEALLLDPLGVAVHQRARLFNVVSGVVIDRSIRFVAEVATPVGSNSMEVIS